MYLFNSVIETFTFAHRLFNISRKLFRHFLKKHWSKHILGCDVFHPSGKMNNFVGFLILSSKTKKTHKTFVGPKYTSGINESDRNKISSPTEKKIVTCQHLHLLSHLQSSPKNLKVFFNMLEKTIMFGLFIITIHSVFHLL